MLSLESPAFAQGGEIPMEYTCEGADRSPPLTWSSLPPGTRSIALIVDDPDAPDPRAPKTTWVHWVVYNLPPTAEGLPAGAADGGLPEGAQQGLNDWKRPAYGGPCPPRGHGPHRYVFRLLALDVETLDLPPGANRSQFDEALGRHALAAAEFMGRFERA